MDRVFQKAWGIQVSDSRDRGIFQAWHRNKRSRRKYPLPCRSRGDPGVGVEVVVVEHHLHCCHHLRQWLDYRGAAGPRNRGVLRTGGNGVQNGRVCQTSPSGVGCWPPLRQDKARQPIARTSSSNWQMVLCTLTTFIAPSLLCPDRPDPTQLQKLGEHWIGLEYLESPEGSRVLGCGWRCEEYFM